ncbi:MAG: betaine/proline/choline family ABC transporter ATP-binding protein [Halanaerobiales bacterium]|nr:betaine/proline/choline family ABC transporter ATP-binding protein [Halanaerobiales bacterium]
MKEKKVKKLGKTRVQTRELTKIFGKQEKNALEMLDEGYSKKEIREKSGQLVALSEVFLNIKASEIFVVMGLSGCGKSTLLRCLNGLIQPSRGKVLIDGTDITKFTGRELVDFRRKKLGMVFQHFGLFPHKTVMDNVAYGLEVQGISKKKRKAQVKDKLDLVGLSGWEESYPNELSGGMKQRVGLARALAMEPEILLMDEPFSALDPLIRLEMQEELLELKKQLGEITIVFVTHDLNEAVKMGNRIAIINLDGQIVQINTPAEILENPANEYVENFAEGVDRSKILTAKRIMREPEFVFTPETNLAQDIKKMKQRGINRGFIVDKKDQPVGKIFLEDLEDLSTKEELFKSEKIQSVKCVAQDLPISEFWENINHKQKAVSVIDKKGKLKGIIEAPDIIFALSNQNREED